MLDNLIVALELLVVGMTGVFAVLLFFYGLISLMKKIDEMLKSRKLPEPKEIAPEAPTTMQDQRLVAIISAAAYATIGKSIKVRRIQLLGHQQQDGRWAESGRLSAMLTHNINRKGAK